MKYTFELIIKNQSKKEDILAIQGSGISRSKKGCLKSIRTSINKAIKQDLDHIEEFGE